MAVRLELTGRSMKGLWLATLYVESQLLAIRSFKDTVSGPRIKLGEKPHRFSAGLQCYRNSDPSPASGAVVMRASECERCRQVLPPCKVDFVLGLDAGHKRGASVIGDGRVDFSRRAPDGQQLITIQRNPATCVTLPVQR